MCFRPFWWKSKQSQIEYNAGRHSSNQVMKKKEDRSLTSICWLGGRRKEIKIGHLLGATVGAGTICSFISDVFDKS